MMKLLSVAFALVLLAGCGILPLKPGASSFVRPDGSSVSVVQSENPKTDTVQDYKRTVDPKTGIVVEEVHTKIGAAQKDVAREMVAKLGALRPVMWVGIFVLLFGIASFHPYLRAIVLYWFSHRHGKLQGFVDANKDGIDDRTQH